MIPSPELLAEYERLLPGTSQRLLDLVAEEQRMGERIAEHYVDARLRLYREVMAFSGLVSLIGAATAVVLFLRNEDLGGTLFGVGALAILLVALVSTLMSARPARHEAGS